MKVIGLTGGIGSGKSTIAALARNHFPVEIIYTDDVAKEQMMPGGISYDCVIKEFGRAFLEEDGSINRPKLAQLLFADASKVARMNEITHPNVKQYVLDTIKQYETTEKYEAVIVETALLFDAEFDVFCDETWYVWASDEVRRARLKANRGYSDEKVDAIFASQNKEEYAKKHCTHIICNDGNTSEEEIVSQLREIL